MESSREPPVPVGTVIAEKYLVEKILGEGGMGVVVAARHTGLREMRAIKFMLPGVLRDRMAVERFRREAKAVSRLKSDHVARVYDIDRLPNGAPYIVMEYLEGRDLRAITNANGVLPVALACNYVSQACEAIAEAHTAGIVHRDLKTANLFLTKGPRGEPWIKVLDFGLAKLGSRAGSIQPEITQKDLVLGSPAFMAPEQWFSSRQSDARADIWALGVILYRLTTGVLPFEAPTRQQIALRILSPDRVRKPSAHNRRLPPLLDQIICKCLEKDREQRFQTAHELADALRALTEPLSTKDAETSDHATIELPTRIFERPQSQRAAGRVYSPGELLPLTPNISDSAALASPQPPGEDSDEHTTPPLPSRAPPSAPKKTEHRADMSPRPRPRAQSIPTIPDTRMALVRCGIAMPSAEADVTPPKPKPLVSIFEGMGFEDTGKRRAADKNAALPPGKSLHVPRSSNWRALVVSGIVGAMIGATTLWLALAAGGCTHTRAFGSDSSAAP